MYDSNKNLSDRRELLKIKALSLMAEALIIRREEAKQKAYGKAVALPYPWLLNDMHEHRVKVVRRAARLTHIARGFIKGLALPQMEQYPTNLLTSADWKEIFKMVQQYGKKDDYDHATRQEALYRDKLYGTKPAHVHKPAPSRRDRAEVTA